MNFVDNYYGYDIKITKNELGDFVVIYEKGGNLSPHNLLI